MDLGYVILSVIGGSGAAIAAAAWLASKLVNNRLEKDIENYKLNIQIQSDERIENLKSRLKISEKESELSNSWVYKKRASAIERLHSSFVDIQSSTRDILDIYSPRDPVEIRRQTKSAIDEIRGAYNAYQKSRIYMTSLTCAKIDNFFESIEGPVIRYWTYQGVYDDQELNSLSDIKNGAWKEINSKLPSVVEELEGEFKGVLGIQVG